MTQAMREPAIQLPHLGAGGNGIDPAPTVGRGVHSSAMRDGSPLRAPFPWFGGKSRIAAACWERFGDVANYVEPFAGSLAVLLSRPTAPRIETVNDLDCYLANFWRALAAEPDAVASACDWPVNEADLHARHRWLVGRADFRERMRREPDFYDARIAGWWVWGLCAWIGSGWCEARDAEHVPQQRPHLAGRARPGMERGATDANAGQGVHALGMRAPSEQLPFLGGGNGSGDAGCQGQGVHQPAVRSALYSTFTALAARLRYVRVACGDWTRVVTDSVTWRHGTTAIFLDPPYSTEERQGGLYAQDSATVAAEVRTWCVEHGGDKRLRVALCGYAGEGHEALEALGWSVVAWKAKGGYGGQRKKAKKNGSAGEASEINENAERERVWFSPGCDVARQASLFAPRPPT